MPGCRSSPRCSRAIVAVEPGSVTIRTRRGRNITDQQPELQPLAELGLSVVLEGELVAKAGRAGDFYRVAPAVAARRRGSLTFVAFDLLWADDESLMDTTHERRRARLAGLDLHGALVLVPSWTGHGDARPVRHLFPAIDAALAARLDATYAGAVADVSRTHRELEPVATLTR